jgi:hypothetical protein
LKRSDGQKTFDERVGYDSRIPHHY